MTTEQHRWILGGGLASGKTKVRELLSELGITTVDADSIGHSVIAPDGLAFIEVAKRWPHVVHEGKIHRPSLAEVVFNDPDELAALEEITHPHIMEAIRSQVAGIDTPVVVEIPLLNPRLGHEWRRMVVDCRDEIRLERAIERGMSEVDALARMAAQPSRVEWLAVSDLVVPNHADLEGLTGTVSQIVMRL